MREISEVEHEPILRSDHHVPGPEVVMFGDEPLNDTTCQGQANFAFDCCESILRE